MERSEYVKIFSISMIIAAMTSVITVAALFSLTASDVTERRPIVSATETLFSDGSVVVDTVKKVNPAVVAITISKDVPVYERFYEESQTPWDFFSWSIPQLRQNGTERREIGGGSGFLVSPDGFIVTNRHVVEDDAAAYTVLMNDGKDYEAKVVARDTALDLAILKIDGEDFPYLPFGDSDALEVGQSVIAIGNALAEFRNTVSVGIVSGLSRSIVASDNRGIIESLDQLIQTDAAINQGNSGGPLLNLRGEVIGVNVAVASGAENIGFALASNSVKKAVESVQEFGRISRPFLGVRYIAITPELQERNGLPVDYGALVIRGQAAEDLAVVPGSPADKADIVENDIILEVDGERVTEERSLQSLLRSKSVGQSVRIKLLHNGEERDVVVVLEEMTPS